MDQQDNQDPEKYLKEKKWQVMGNKFRSMQNLEIIKTDINNELIYKGSIQDQGILSLIKKAVKNLKLLWLKK